MPDIVVTKAKEFPQLKLLVTFSDGHKTLVDIGDFIRRHPHPQYNKYLSENMFKKFRIENGNIRWGRNGDLEFHIEDLYCGKLD